MIRTFAALVCLIAASVPMAEVMAAPLPQGGWPQSKGMVRFDTPYVVKAGTVFDGGMKTYERSNVQCQGQKESGAKDAVFLVEPGATLKNVIIGKNQMEGVHCDKHNCKIENVWWDDVCEDALTIKGGSAGSVSTVTGGGARYADDKVVQHNGPGKVIIDGFYADTFGKLYRSCGTCGRTQRQVIVANVLAVNPKASIVTVNKNNDDKATLRNIHVQSVKKVTVCGWSQATQGGEPKKLGAGPSGSLCNYAQSDIHLMNDREAFEMGTEYIIDPSELGADYAGTNATDVLPGKVKAEPPVETPAPVPTEPVTVVPTEAPTTPVVPGPTTKKDCKAVAN